MSVDHYDCDACGETGVYEEYINTCVLCGNRVCDNCSDEIRTDPEDKLWDEDGYLKEEYCPFCSGDKISDRQRVDELLSMLDGVTIEAIDNKILEKRKAKNQSKEQ